MSYLFSKCNFKGIYQNAVDNLYSVAKYRYYNLFSLMRVDLNYCFYWLVLVVFSN